MLFNSYAFILIFLPLILLAWYGLGRWANIRLLFLVVGSFVFYGWAKWEFTILLAVSTLIDYYVGLRIYTANSKRIRASWLMISLTTNLGLLGYFKYCGFLLTSYNSLVEFLHTGYMIYVPDIVLPVGISFYTFQTLSYSIDIFRGQVAPAKSLLHFAAYVSMFPQLIAGPIVRYQDIESQLNSLSRQIDWDVLQKGVWFFAIGMSQKILIADSLAAQITPLLSSPESLQFITGWYSLLGYTAQLYFDFAGYSNMAIGLGYFLGFHFPPNFNSPYKATSIQDFWRRWHITLSTFLRDYLYIPLGGNRTSKLIVIRNLFIVMALGGLWHGAGWNFVLWGVYHGLLLAMYSIYQCQNKIRLPRIFAVSVTFFFVMLGWLLFRSTDLSMALQWLVAIMGLNQIESSALSVLPTFAVSILALALAICFLLPNANECKPNQSVATTIVLVALLVICVMRFDVESPFLYFQF